MSEAPGRLSMQAAAPIFRRQRELQKFATMADITVGLQRVEGENEVCSDRADGKIR